MLENLPLIGRISRLASSSSSPLPSVAGDPDADPQIHREKFPRGQLDGGVNCFSEPPATDFSVRGKQYLSGAAKVAHTHAGQAFPLLDVELVESRVGKLENFAAHPESFACKRLAENRPGEFLLIVNFLTDRFHMVVTYSVVQAAVDKDPTFARMWRAFLDGSPQYRAERLKVIPRIVEGPFMVRKVIGEKPAIMGRKLGFTYFQSDRYLEIDCDTASTRAAALIVEVVTPVAANLVIDQAYLLEGQNEDELPERIMGTVRVSRMHLRQSKVITSRGSARLQPGVTRKTSSGNAAGRTT